MINYIVILVRLGPIMLFKLPIMPQLCSIVPFNAPYYICSMHKFIKFLLPKSENKPIFPTTCYKAIESIELATDQFG